MEIINTDNSELRKKILRMDSFLDLDRFGKEDKVSPKDIEEYYKITDSAYKKYHSKLGFMHFHVSKNDTISPEDGFYQPNKVASFIKPGNKVLELGFGKGPNIFYLAEKFPDVDFNGVDLAPTNKENTFDNVQLFRQDYRDLSRFADNTFDIVYAIETICCLTDKSPVFREAYRVLKPGGRFIIYDSATPEDFSTYDAIAQKGIALYTRAGTGALVDSEEQWEKLFTENGFHEESITDLTKEVLPDMKRLENLATGFMESKIKAKMAFRVLPDKLVGNAITGYITYDCFNEGFIAYKEWIFVK